MELVICDADTKESILHLKNCIPVDSEPNGAISELSNRPLTCILMEKEEKAVRVRAFGRFEVFVHNTPVDFHSAKAKELFALCVDHAGGNVSMQEAIDKLWENRPFDERVKRLYRKAVMTINRTFRSYKMDQIFDTSRGYCRVNAEAIDCDYFSFLK